MNSIKINFCWIARSRPGFLLAAFFCISSVVSTAQIKKNGNTGSPAQVISYVDASLQGSQKYVLKVDGKPFYMTNIQIRLEKLRYSWGFDATARDAVIGQAAADGFNTVSLPIHWYEVEQTKDHFNWSILDEYLGLASKHNLKVELLWFGQNSGGNTQWLSPQHLRTPDYVLYSPKKGSTATTSDYHIRRDLSPYTLDLDDKKLQARETYVLGKVMAHIALWDKANGAKHTVIGVQLDNEVAAPNFDGELYTAGQVISYMSGLGSAVKKSPYVVWTRINCIWGMEEGRIDVNEAFRATIGTNIDFAGVDLYGASPATVQSVLPYKGKNYRMIMECGAEVANAAQTQLTALSGNNAYDHYDLLSSDGHGLYNRVGTSGFAPHGAYVTDVITVNKLLNSDMADIAQNAQGYGLFVHNWAGDDAAPTTGVGSIVFTPASSLSQAISINRSPTEIVLMNTKGGTFTFPDSLAIAGASYGYFDKNNKWVDTGKAPFTRTSASPAPGTTVRLTRHGAAPSAVIIKQAEFGSYGLGSTTGYAHVGFAGNGYVDLDDKGGYVSWSNLDGQAGGTRTIRIRYANGGSESRTERLLINRAAQSITFPPTGSWETYKFVNIQVPFTGGITNVIRIEWTEQGRCLIDEMQILK